MVVARARSACVAHASLAALWAPARPVVPFPASCVCILQSARSLGQKCSSTIFLSSYVFVIPLFASILYLLLSDHSAPVFININKSKARPLPDRKGGHPPEKETIQHIPSAPHTLLSNIPGKLKPDTLLFIKPLQSALALEHPNHLKRRYTREQDALPDPGQYRGSRSACVAPCKFCQWSYQPA